MAAQTWRAWCKQSKEGPEGDFGGGCRLRMHLYVHNGAVELDNNLVENAIRPTAIGKKNYPSLRSGSAVWLRCSNAAVAAWQGLFIGEAQAGDRSAILYTIVEACRSRGLDPWSYLRDVLTRLPTMTNRQVKDLLPAAWAKTQAETKRMAA